MPQKETFVGKYNTLICYMDAVGESRYFISSLEHHLLLPAPCCNTIPYEVPMVRGPPFGSAHSPWPSDNRKQTHCTCLRPTMGVLSRYPWSSCPPLRPCSTSVWGCATLLIPNIWMKCSECPSALVKERKTFSVAMNRGSSQDNTINAKPRSAP